MVLISAFLATSLQVNLPKWMKKVHKNYRREIILNFMCCAIFWWQCTIPCRTWDWTWLFPNWPKLFCSYQWLSMPWPTNPTRYGTCIVWGLLLSILSYSRGCWFDFWGRGWTGRCWSCRISGWRLDCVCGSGWSLRVICWGRIVFGPANWGRCWIFGLWGWRRLSVGCLFGSCCWSCCCGWGTIWLYFWRCVATNFPVAYYSNSDSYSLN